MKYKYNLELSVLVLIQMARRSTGCGEKALLAHQRNHHKPPILKYANTLDTNTNFT